MITRGVASKPFEGTASTSISLSAMIRICPAAELDLAVRGGSSHLFFILGIGEKPGSENISPDVPACMPEGFRGFYKSN